MLKTRQTILQLQHDNNLYANQLEKYRSNVGKLQVEIGEKRNVRQRNLSFSSFLLWILVHRTSSK